MATINYTTDLNAASGAVKVTWSGMAGGDVGQVFDCAGLKLGSVQYFGTFNGGDAQLQASNEVSPTTFITVNNKGEPAIETEINDIPTLLGAVRSAFSGSGGSITVAALFVRP